MVVTDRGPIALQNAFELGETYQTNTDGDIAIPANLKAITSSGNLQKVRAVFRHSYEGEMIKVKPYYLPSITCTPDHRVYATDDITVSPAPVYAKDLTKKYYLAVPRSYKFSLPQVIDAGSLLGSYSVTFQTPWKLSGDDMQRSWICLLMANHPVRLEECLRKVVLIFVTCELKLRVDKCMKPKLHILILKMAIYISK